MMIMIKGHELAYNTKIVIKNNTLKVLKDVDETWNLARMNCG
jgi:hypothetical protein